MNLLCLNYVVNDVVVELVLHLQIHHLLELEFYITNIHDLLELALS